MKEIFKESTWMAEDGQECGEGYGFESHPV